MLERFDGVNNYVSIAIDSSDLSILLDQFRRIHVQGAKRRLSKFRLFLRVSLCKICLRMLFDQKIPEING